MPLMPVIQMSQALNITDERFHCMLKNSPDNNEINNCRFVVQKARTATIKNYDNTKIILISNQMHFQIEKPCNTAEPYEETAYLAE